MSFVFACFVVRDLCRSGCGQNYYQEIEVSVPTGKRRISDGLSEEDSNSVSLERKPWEKIQTKVKELTKMLKMILLYPIRFSFWPVDYALEGSKFWLTKFDFCRLFHTGRSWHAYWFSVSASVSGRQGWPSYPKLTVFVAAKWGFQFSPKCLLDLNN